MNAYKWFAILNVCVSGTFIVAVTIASVHFETVSLLWWYVLLPFIQWTIKGSSEKQSNGKWKLGKGVFTYYCSVCEQKASPREADEWMYCPRCGAKMKGE